MAGYFDSYRNIFQRVTITNTQDVIESGIVKITIEQVTSSDRTLRIGEFCKNSVKIIYRGEAMPWRGSRILVQSILSGAVNSLGYYFVDKVTYDGVKYTITGYDTPPEMDELYDVNNGLTTSGAIVSAIMSTTGMTMNSEALPAPNFPIKSVPEGTTNRQMLAYIYGYEGNNLRVNVSDGEIHRYWYSRTTTRSIPRTAQYQNQLRSELQEVTITSLRTGTQDNVIELGSGFGIVYYNPYITANAASAIFNRIYGTTYYIGECKYRGNPGYQAGNMASVELADGTSATMYIMAQTFNCDGGMNAVIKSYGNEQTTAVIRGSNVDQKIEKVYQGLQAALQEAMETLLGQPDGYFSLLQDSDGNYIGWQITNTPGEPVSNTHGWRWTYGGLMWSEDGFQTPQMAITNDGYIVGERITAQSITFDQLTSALQDRILTVEGVTNLVNQWMQFTSSDGLLIGDTNGATVAQMKSDGFRILDAADTTNVLLSAIANGDTSEVTATNLVSKNFLVLDYGNYTGRFEPYSDSYDAKQIGFYYI